MNSTIILKSGTIALTKIGRGLMLMLNELTKNIILSEADMQQIEKIVNELKTIMQSSDISQTRIVNALDGKCARNTILSFFKGDADCKLSTLLMILDACGVELRMETERSRQAILSGDIAEYRAEVERVRSDLSSVQADRDFYKTRYEELVDKNTALTNTVEKQQGQIEKYMQRMERAEDAIYRKDARIVELSKLCGKW